jgi:hypothetical protein
MLPGQKAQGAQPPGPARSAPLRLAAIDRAIDQLVAAKQQLSGNGELVAQANLREAILGETERLSRRRAVAGGERRPCDVRRVEARINSAYANSGDKAAYVSEAIRENQRGRLPIELREVSDSMAKAQAGQIAQIAEAMEDSVVDASNWVAEPRATDGPDADQVRKSQFARLDDLLKAIPDLDDRFLAVVIIRCADPIDLSRFDDFQTLRKIVLANCDTPTVVRVDAWINTVSPQRIVI